jgi:hypothetical protein
VVEFNSTGLSNEAMGGESTGRPIDEGKQRRCEAAQLDALRKAVWHMARCRW